MGLCAGTQFGRLIMNAETFAGKHRLINVPANGEYSSHMKYGRFEETEQSGKYAVVFANCNDEGRSVIIEGHTVWKSRHGCKHICNIMISIYCFCLIESRSIPNFVSLTLCSFVYCSTYVQIYRVTYSD